MAQEDVAFMSKTLLSEDIYSAYPDPKRWRSTVAEANREAVQSLPEVRDVPGYRAALRRYVGRFQDPHLAVRIDVEPVRLKWPQFIVGFRDHHFVILWSQTSAAAVGARISDCDGTELTTLADRLAPGYGQVSGIDASRAAIARLLFVDEGTALARPPVACRIDGHDVALAWVPVTSERLAAISAPLRPQLDDTASISNFGAHGAWVRMPFFLPANRAQADQFRSLISQASGLRDRSVVVIDVRGNRGGPYNWFMAFLNEFYGTEYVRYYARARLLIQPAWKEDPGAATDGTDPLATPADPDVDVIEATGRYEEFPGGLKLFVRTAPDTLHPRKIGSPPSSPVKARVYVLTDYGCGSSCISLIDEIRLLPGAKQIGVETFVDRRSGSPKSYPLPSGNGFFSFPTLIRLHRTRDDNAPQRPDADFPGDVDDTAAVRRWIISDVAPADGISP